MCIADTNDDGNSSVKETLRNDGRTIQWLPADKGRTRMVMIDCGIAILDCELPSDEEIDEMLEQSYKDEPLRSDYNATTDSL